MFSALYRATKAPDFIILLKGFYAANDKRRQSRILSIA